jgi:hypothetical protein
LFSAILSSPIVQAYYSAPPATFKLAFYNIRSGEGSQPLKGHPSTFAETINCDPGKGAVNAWGAGVVQRELVDRIGKDADVVALGLAEAWNCGAPANVREVLGWKSASEERNGTALVARYGFKRGVSWHQLDTSQNKNPRDTMWVGCGAICLDGRCANTVDMCAAHWSGTGPRGPQTYEQQARDTVQFMTAIKGPHALLGDLNVFEGNPVCGQQPNSTALAALRSAGYVDAWPAVHGTEEGYTGMVNRRGCGSPEGYVWKRIDYAWSRGLKPVDMGRFGIRPPGEGSPSDHLGIVVTYAMP